MGLIIKTQIETENGQIVENSYIRVMPILMETGNMVKTTNMLYISKESFNSGKKVVYSPNVPINSEIVYDRLANGNDILDFALQQVKSELVAKNLWSELSVEIEPLNLEI